MASRADRHKPSGYVPPPRRNRVAASLPPDQAHYEFLRVLEPNPGTEGMWKLSIQYGQDGLPLLAESSPPPFQAYDPIAFFGRQAPLEIEIGMGKGSFLLPYAKLRPEHNILGIEWTWPIALHAHAHGVFAPLAVAGAAVAAVPADDMGFAGDEVADPTAHNPLSHFGNGPAELVTDEPG